jgi:hypothetical protein
LWEEDDGPDGQVPLGGEREEGLTGLGWSRMIWAGWFPGAAQVGC